jgi:hypothetical protein
MDEDDDQNREEFQDDGGEALNLDGDFNESEEEVDEDEEEMMKAAQEKMD